MISFLHVASLTRKDGQKRVTTVTHELLESLLFFGNEVLQGIKKRLMYTVRQKLDCCLTGSARTFVEACLDWSRVPVRARDLSAELEERASIDIVRG